MPSDRNGRLAEVQAHQINAPETAVPDRESTYESAPSDVAIVGMAGLFPGSNDLPGFWHNLIEQKTFLSAPPEGRFGPAGDCDGPHGAFLDDIDRFDADFFRMSPREAARMDPQQRLLLQVAWQAVEDAGYSASEVQGKAGGVFIAAAMNEYFDLVKRATAGSTTELSDVYFNLSANRISHVMGLSGPSELIQTACSGSMAAIHRAIWALHSGECDFALAGGVNLLICRDTFSAFTNASILSPDGTCRVFDHRGRGFVRGEAAAIVMLKLRSKAIADRDHVYAVIKGSAVRHTGTSRSLLSLDPTAQMETVVAACAKAGVKPSTIRFVEMQGSGKLAGDTTELQAIAEGLARLSDREETSVAEQRMLGCLKPNFGHLEAAAGIAGVMKVALALQRRCFPGIAGWDAQHSAGAELQKRQFNPFGGSEPDAGEVPLRAVVNGFGFGGTNAHIVMEAGPCVQASADGARDVIVLSARDPDALQRSVVRLRDFLQRTEWHAGASLGDIAFTLQSGRVEMSCRLAIVADSKSQLVARLDDYIEGQDDPFVVRSESQDGSVQGRLGDDPEDQEYFGRLWTAGKHLKLAALWTSGARVHWDALPGRGLRRRTSLPTYPFAGERHWITDGMPAETVALGAPFVIANPLRELVLREICQTLGLPPAQRDSLEHRGFASLGVDSLLALILQRRLEAKVNTAIPLKSFLDAATPGGVIADLITAGAIERSGALELASANPGSRYEPFPLTDIQLAYYIGREDTHALSGNGCHLYWEFERADWDIERLERAWQKLVDRHDMLRAVFTSDAQQQVLSAPGVHRFQVYDLRECDAECGGHLLQVREQLSHQRFDIGKWPLFAIAVTKFRESMRLHLSLDLLIADGMSIFLLLREWAEHYEQPDVHAEPLGIAFRDYVLDLQKQRGGPRYEKALAYWRGRMPLLAGPPALPTVRDAASLGSVRYTRHESRLKSSEWDRFKGHASRYGLTAPAVLLAAFCDVLGRWSESESFTVNLTVSHRPPIHAEIHSVVGDFTSNVLLATTGGVGASFRERAARLRNQLVEDLDHAIVSGVQVLGELSRQRKTTVSMPVVFTSFLGYTGAVGRNLSIEALGTFVTGVTQTPQVWLDAQAVEMDGGLYLSWDCVDEMFPSGMPGDMFSAFAELVERLACDVTCWDELRPARIPERQMGVRRKANATQRSYGPELLHQGFLDQVERDPERVAVIAPDARLSYGELLSRAATIAQRIREAGIGKNSLVAVVMEKSAAQVVGAVAVLMAGGAYLPIDPSLPEKRVRELLALGKVSVALTQMAGAGRLAGVRALCVDGPQGNDEGVAACPAVPGDLAYVIFTSGSTGVPKGVMVQHGAAANTIRDINERFGVNADDRVLALSSLSFDLSVYDIFGILAAGGAIVIPDHSEVRNPEYLARLLEREKVTIWNSVPSYLQMIVESGVACRANLRLAMLSGDWIPVSLPAKIERGFPGARVISLGGATEASIWSIYHAIDHVAPEATSIPYGTPLANQRFHVLNAQLEDCPEWIAGELYIAGDGLAAGYWEDTAKTEASFPTCGALAERLYQTGDWGRYLPDGSIEFLGRRDLQVKIGGHRVELGEVESVLAQCPGVRQAVAVTFADEWKQKRLGVALVAQSGCVVDAGAVRKFLKSRVAEYMVPQEIRVVASVPLTPNGKVDRRALESAMRSNAMVEELRSDGVLKDAKERRHFVSQRLGVRRDVEGTGIALGDAGIDTRLRTVREFSLEPLEKLGVAALLSCLRGMEAGGKTKYLFPSAGDGYAVQTYLDVKVNRIREMPGGVYYYQPVRNELLFVGEASESAMLHFPANQVAAHGCAFSIYLIADLSAIRPLYGKVGKEFCQIEAGHMGQLLRQSAAGAGLGLCPIGYLQFDEIRSRLGLSEDHQFIYGFLGGVEGVALPHRPACAKPSLRMAADEHEPTIARMWSVVLKMEAAIPRDVNFFELGGNSFAALELHKRLTVEAGLTLSVTDLFRYPTIQSLAAHLREESSSVGDRVATVSVPSQNRRELRRSVRAQICEEQRS